MATEGHPRPNLFSSNPLLEFKFRLFVANAIVGVAAVILMTPGVVYQSWHGDEKAEVGYCQVTVILSLTLPVEKPLR